MIYSSLFDQACYEQPSNTIPEIKLLAPGTMATIAALNLPIFFPNTGFTMLMDTPLSTASVKDIDYLKFTKVPSWCQNVNAPPNFRKILYKEILL